MLICRYDLTPGFVVAISDGDSTYVASFCKVAGHKDMALDASAILKQAVGPSH